MPQGRISIRGTTLIIPHKKGDPFRLQQVLSFNAGIRIPLLTEMFTGPTQEPDHPNLLHRLTPTAGSLEQSGKDKISIKVFCNKLYVSLNHKPSSLSTGILYNFLFLFFLRFGQKNI